MQIRLLIISFYLLSALNSYADTTLLLDAKSDGIDISNAAQYVCIKENITRIEEIKNYTFIPWTKGLINFGFTTDYCWIKFDVLNTELLEQTYYLTTRFNFVDHLDVFYQQHNTTHHIPLGDQHPLAERDYNSSRQIGKITLAPNEKLTLYIKSYTNATLVVPISIFAEKPFITYLSIMEWGDGIFYGSLFGLLILSLLLYWYFRDPTYASYFFHVVFMMLLLINMDGKTIYLWPTQPLLIDYAHMIFTSLTMITAVIFARFYLNLTQYKTLHTLSNFNIAITATYILLTPFLPIAISNMASAIISIIVALFLLITGIIQLKRGLLEAIYYCAGWGVLLLATILISSTIFSNLLALDQMLIIIKFSFVMQQIILCIGLSMKIKMLQKEKEISQAASVRHQLEMDTRNEFFAKMSHEIRTPINGVMGCLQLIDKSQLNDIQQDYLNTAHNSADILLCIVNDILDLSKIEAGKLKLENKPLDIRQLIHESVQVFELERKKNHVKFIQLIANDVPQIIISDAIRLHQILLNLISNAIKFTPEGSITIKIDLLAIDKEKCQLQCKVIDTGIGMEAKEKDTLFHPFQQAIQSNKNQSRGTGLGLSICKQLCELMQGSISVESHINVGTTFTFSITAEIPSSNITLTDKQKGISETFKDLSGLTILFAEDNPTNAKVLEGILKKLNANFEATFNGLKALEAYKASPHKYDVILMDCEMPEMDGYSASYKIRQFEKMHNLRHIPIIALTAHASEDTAENCISVGMNSHLSKPINIQQLINEIMRLIKNNSSLSD